MRRSLDEIERELWNPGTALVETGFREMELTEGEAGFAADEDAVFSLDGEWMMAEGGEEYERLSGEWGDGIAARVPGSVHTALFEAGRIPDPLVGLNDKIAREFCYKEWWFRKEFLREELADAGVSGQEILRFDGICYRAHVWLNGTFLGTHSGMFGSPEFEIGDLLADRNVLVVKIDNAPARPKALSDFMDNDEGWHDGVVINCVYGWHYACLPSRGIWAPVSVRARADLVFDRPLVAAVDAQAGVVDICTKILRGCGKGKAFYMVRPKNFEGKAWHFETDWEGKEGDVLHYRVRIQEPRLWWPNGYGEQNLYSLTVSYVFSEGGKRFDTSFGIRTIEMGPLPGGPYEDRHNWTYMINGKKIFIKGANWCTLDVLLRFPKKRYERFLSLAKAGHVMLLRAWGGGMPESEEFYDLCDEYGIMVMQEWPTCWDSQKDQPYAELEETVLHTMPRIRNHPSLIMWCGGNESKLADGPAMDMMARYAFELDGSRPFHRTSPWGGALHNYSTYWDMQDIDVSLRLRSHFIGEFGMASVPDMASVRKYVPGEELTVWPPDQYGSFAHHTPRFNQFDPNDMDYLMKHAAEFDPCDTMEGFVRATQIAQATGVRHTLEAARACWPEATGICYYKLTDVYPAASWSTIDYYGVPKLSYYILADAYEPLRAAVLFDSTRASGGLWVPVQIFDDADRLAGREWKAVIRAFNRDLTMIECREYAGSGSVSGGKQAGIFSLLEKQVDGRLLLITAELLIDGASEPVHRTFYWLNYQGEPGALFHLPETELSMELLQEELQDAASETAGGEEKDGPVAAAVSSGRDNPNERRGTVSVRNQGAYPAVGVTVLSAGEEEDFVVQDNVFWLNPGEERRLLVNRTKNLSVQAFNAQK